ncbi:MAG: hypothetical protein KC457_21105, partial [Myxococcales bacterium]|nr:hypothetical protein [Myxococcales bacterium]
MQVDRSRFLLLTASLAAAACNQRSISSPPDTEDGASTTTGGASTTTGDRPTDSGPSTGGAAKDQDPGRSSDPGAPQVWLEIEPGTEDRQPQWGSGDCDNSVGQPDSCGSLSAPGSHCESFDSTRRLCQAFPSFMQPRAAEAAVSCMLAASGSQRICDWEIWQQCTSAGIQATCVEPATRSECESISSNCGGSVDVFSCQQAMSAVRPHEMSNVGSCIREFCEIP